MARFLTTSGAVSGIESIINEADKWLVLISPYVAPPEYLFQCLREADRKNIKITLVYGKGQLKSDVMKQLKQLKNLSLRYLDNLHAKCCFNENNMVITSLNLLESSERKNREMGILINSVEDAHLYREAVKEAKLIINSAEEEVSHKSSKSVTQSQASTRGSIGKGNGFCIRCGETIAYNLKSPFCRSCYAEWAIWKNPNWIEHFCHACGDFEPTTINYPLCDSCYYGD